MIKATLKPAVDGATPGDVSDAKMVWIYALSRSIPGLAAASDAWAAAVGMADASKPLAGYAAEALDPRRPEWRPLDIGAQEAAERGGTTLDAAWEV